MFSDQTVRFVGLYASFPVTWEERKVEILEALLALEDELPFQTVTYGKVPEPYRREAFSTARWPMISDSIKGGKANYVNLRPYRKDSAWPDALASSVSVVWSSFVVDPKLRPRSPVEKRFGHAGTIIITYPLERFLEDAESPFQFRLLACMRELFVRFSMHYAFIHQGYRLRRPMNVGADRTYESTREGFPLTSFESDLWTGAALFKEYVKGAFWGNFLTHLHLGEIGGVDSLRVRVSPDTLDPLADGRVLLRIGPSPLTRDMGTAAARYQHLRRIMAPILLETSDEMVEFQQSVMGDWKSPLAPG